MAALRISTATLSRKAITASRPRLYLGVRAGLRPLQPTSSSTSISSRYSTTAPLQSLAPKIERGGSKLFKDADAAVADLKSGSTILSSGFGLCGVAGTYRADRVM
jgi:3-oxoacid CoA-transferase